MFIIITKDQSVTIWNDIFLTYFGSEVLTLPLSPDISLAEVTSLAFDLQSSSLSVGVMTGNPGGATPIGVTRG